jgi:oligopeptide transport system permease protein
MTVQLDTISKGARSGGTPLTRKRENLWQDAFRRLLRNKAAVAGGIFVLILAFTAIFADFIAILPYDKQTLVDQNKVPAWIGVVFPSMLPYMKVSDKYPVGADYVGRDLFSRMVYGTRISMTIALVGPLISLVIGVFYGSISGFFGGRVDNIMMRIVDVLYAFPGLLFIILLMSFFRSSLSDPSPGTPGYLLGQLDKQLGGMLFIMVGIGLTAWETQARMTRGQVLSVREKEYIEAAHMLGVSNLRIMFRHILPNIIGPLIVVETLAIPGYIALEAFLSFIGLGINPPVPSWGAMIADGSRVIRTYPNQAIFPALALAMTMFAFNFLGDGLRDALEPKMRGTQ